jgi:hypothetical protein
MLLAVSVPWRRVAMGQTSRILKRAYVLPDLMKMLQELDELRVLQELDELRALQELDKLREKVRLAEAARVLH